MSRRAVLAAGGAGLTGTCAGASPPLRVAATGWAGAQTLLALGATPIALPEVERYNSLVVEPPTPPDIQELGLRSEPNLELLIELAPDLIITEAGAEVARSVLERIAPVETFSPIKRGRAPTVVAREATVALAARLDQPEAAVRYLAGFDERIEAASRKLGAYDGGPLCLVSDIFGNRALVFGADSLYQDVLDRAGIGNAFAGATSVWGHTTVGLDELAAMPRETRLVILNARMPNMRALLAARPLYRALPMIREDRVTILSDILFYGGLPSADRFARLLAERLPLGRDARD